MLIRSTIEAIRDWRATAKEAGDTVQEMAGARFRFLNSIGRDVKWAGVATLAALVILRNSRILVPLGLFGGSYLAIRYLRNGQAQAAAKAGFERWAKEKGKDVKAYAESLTHAHALPTRGAKEGDWALLRSMRKYAQLWSEGN